jgi:hypothetical protein
MRRPLFLGSLLLLPSLLSAQHHAAVFAPALRPIPAPVAATSLRPGAIARTVPAPTATVRRSPNRPYPGSSRRPAGSRIAPPSSRFDSSRNDGSNSLDGFDDTQVPGLGFDYVHFAATHPNQAHHNNRQNGFVVPLFGGGYYPYYGVADEATSQPAGEQQADEPQYDQPPLMRRQRSTQLAEVPTPPTNQSSAYPLPDSDEYVFVRRDGTVFFAVAYTWDLKTLRYITSQGLRQSISSDALDLDATHQFNEQRGLSFRSPA